jgi:hypothetical protein
MWLWWQSDLLVLAADFQFVLAKRENFAVKESRQAREGGISDSSNYPIARGGQQNSALLEVFVSRCPN